MANTLRRLFAAAALLAPAARSFTPFPAVRSPSAVARSAPSSLVIATATAATPEAAAGEEAKSFGPYNAAALATDSGVDFVPLADLLLAGDFQEADQVTRDLLITLAGPGSEGRKFVYFTEVAKIPNDDLAVIENLWQKYSGGRYGYSIQRKQWAKAGDFDAFCDKIGWLKLADDGETMRKLRWFGQSEFTYDLTGPLGHLPLTSALRGTRLLEVGWREPV